MLVIKVNVFLTDYDPFYDSDIGTNLLSGIMTSLESESECKCISYKKAKVLIASKLQIHRLEKLKVAGRLEALPSLAVRQRRARVLLLLVVRPLK